MDGRQVRELEQVVEAAIAKVLRRFTGGGTLNPSSDRVYHFMAKAAVAVFEAVDKHGGKSGHES